MFNIVSLLEPVIRICYSSIINNLNMHLAEFEERNLTFNEYLSQRQCQTDIFDLYVNTCLDVQTIFIDYADRKLFSKRDKNLEKIVITFLLTDTLAMFRAIPRTIRSP